MWFLRFAIPVMCVRWWIKFGSIHTEDPDYTRARTAVSVLAGLLLLGIVGPRLTIGGRQF
jgi:hypothetical protein